MQEKSKYNVCVNIDWLSLLYIIPEAKNPSADGPFLNNVQGYYIEENSGTNVWSKRYIIYDSKGRKMLTWLTNPKSSMLNQSMSLVEFANSTLYTGEWRKMLELLSSFKDGYIHGISRLDVCVDFQYCLNEKQQNVEAVTFCNRLLTSQYYVSGKQKGAAFYDYVDKDEKIIASPIQMSWGSKNSTFKWKMYNKSKEIRDKERELRKAKSSSSYKPYIKKIWQMVGFDESLDVWRLECSISSANSISLKNVAGDEMLDIDYLKYLPNVMELFRYLQVNKFSVRVNEGKANKFNNTVVEMFGWKFGDWEVSRKTTACVINKKAPIYYVRMLFNTLHEKLFLFNITFRESILSQMEEAINVFDLSSWFKINYQISFEAYKESVLNSCDFKDITVSEDYQKEVEINLFTNLKS